MKKTIQAIDGNYYTIDIQGRDLTSNEIESLKRTIPEMITKGASFQSLAPCTVPNVVQETSHTINVAATGGQSPFTFRWYKVQGTGTPTMVAEYISTVATETVHSFTYTYPAADNPVGAYSLYGEVKDSCTTPAPQIKQSSMCDYTVLSAGTQCTALNVTVNV